MGSPRGVTKGQHRPVALAEPGRGVACKNDKDHCASAQADGRERSSTISEGMPPGTSRKLHTTMSEALPPSPRIPVLDMPMPPPPPSSPPPSFPHAATQDAAPATYPIRTRSGDADLSALQRLFPEDSEYRVAAPGRSLLWEGRCTCMHTVNGASVLRPVCSAQQKSEDDSSNAQDATLPDYHLLLFNDSLVWARRSAATISSPHHPLDFRVLRTVKVRQEADRNSPAIGHLERGTIVTIVERRENHLGQVRARIAASFASDACGGGWVSITTEEGETLLSPVWLDVHCSFEEEGELGLVLGELHADTVAGSSDLQHGTQSRIVLLGVRENSRAAAKPELLELCEQLKPAKLVTVQGDDIHAKSFEQVLELLRAAPRPLRLGFKYQPTADMTADCRVATLNHLRPQALTHEHSLVFPPQPSDMEHTAQNICNMPYDLRLERYPDTVVGGRYLSRLFAIRECVVTPPPSDDSDSSNDSRTETAVVSAIAPEYRWWIFSLFDQDETENLIAQLATRIQQQGQRVAPEDSPELFPYGFLTPRPRSGLTVQKQPQIILDGSTVLSHRQRARKLEWAHDEHGKAVFVAQEMLSESGSTQTRSVSVQFSATEGVVTTAVPEAKLRESDTVRFQHSAANSHNNDVIIGIFPIDSIRSFECNSAKTVFRLHFHRHTGTKQNDNGRHDDGEAIGGDPAVVHGLDVDSVYFRTDQAEGMRQAMSMAWSDATNRSMKPKSDELQEQRRQREKQLRCASDSPRSPGLVADAFAAWRGEVLQKSCGARARTLASGGTFDTLQQPESMDATALHVQIVQFRPLPWSSPVVSGLEHNYHLQSSSYSEKERFAEKKGAALETASDRWQYQIQLGNRQFFQSRLSSEEIWRTPHVFTIMACKPHTVDTSAEISVGPETDTELCVHLCRCLPLPGNDNAAGYPLSPLYERCGTARIDLSELTAPRDNDAIDDTGVDAVDEWALVRAPVLPGDTDDDMSGVAIAMVRVAVLRVTQANYVQLVARGITCARDCLIEQDSHGAPLRDQHGFLFLTGGIDGNEDVKTKRLAWRSLQKCHRCIAIAQDEHWAQQVNTVDERLREQVWRGVSPKHRRSVWAALIGADRHRAMRSPIWYDECLEVSAASASHLPGAQQAPPSSRARSSESEQEFASVCAFIRTVGLPQQVVRSHHADLCRRVLLAFCAHAHRNQLAQTEDFTGPACTSLSMERMQNCVSAMASVITFLHSNMRSEEDTFWLFVLLADSGFFFREDGRTLADLQKIDTDLLQQAPELRAHLARLECPDEDTAVTGCAGFVFREMYQPLLTLLTSAGDDGVVGGADLGLSRLWDVFFMEGRPALCASIVALLRCSADKLVSLLVATTSASGESTASPAARVLQEHSAGHLLQNADALLLTGSDSTAAANDCTLRVGVRELLVSEGRSKVWPGNWQDGAASGRLPENRFRGRGEADIFLEFAEQSERQTEAAWLQRKHTHLRNMEKAARRDLAQATIAAAQAAAEVQQLELKREEELARAVQERAAAAAASRRQKRAQTEALSLELELRSLRLLVAQQDRARSLGSQQQNQQDAVSVRHRSSSAEDLSSC